ncbi:MAG TPA: hypothetical protein VF883_25345 [Thermoanaerobaculia bacterium]|jgi:hypothetical protein
MRNHLPKSHRRRRNRGSRGSALLVSLMVMVGLSLLGLSFVAISETENAISVNERNKTQTTHLAEAGAKTVVQWFQDPATMKARGLLPANDVNFKTERLVSAYKGYYKPTLATDVLFDTPFGPKERDMFFGDEEHADIKIIDEANTASTAFLKTLNESLFANDDAGKITAIRVYAPPNVGGTTVNGFWVGGQRYGVATIAVTAQKFSKSGTPISQSVCRMVLAPFPLPGPSGAIQSVGGIETNGAYVVHWGAVESEQTTTTFVKREFTSFPWFDAYDHAYFEQGYDSSRVWQPGTVYIGHADTGKRLGDTVRPTTAAIAQFHEFVAIQGGTSHTTEPNWSLYTGAGATVTDGTVVWRRRSPSVYPIAVSTGPVYRRRAWLWEMIGRSVEDPWFQVRTRGRIDGKEYGQGPANIPHAYDYAANADANMAIAGNFATPGANRSHYFQYQTFNQRDQYKQVAIPRFDYDFWKSAAIAGRGQEGVYYLEHVGSGKFSDGVTTQTFEDWIDDKQGFLFFDSENNLNPQNGGGTLVQSAADPCGAKGVIYMNFKQMKSTGCDGKDGYYNMPGEHYRDIGYRKVNEVTSGGKVKGDFTTDAAGNFITDKAFNGEWDYQPLPWSNGGVADNGVFDVCLAQKTLTRESDGNMNAWVPLPYYPGCTVGNNIATPGCNCSEPHEPYLNLRYRGAKVGVEAGWDDPNNVISVYPKKTTDKDDPSTAPVACTAADVATVAGQEKCATNAFDRRGALAFIEKHAGGANIGAEGVLYNEGTYDSTGNAAYYGAVVVKGTVSPNGTQEIWFDECLVKECWPPSRIPFPRVLVTSTHMQ